MIGTERDVLAKFCAELRAKGHEPGFPELGAVDHQQLAIEIDVAVAESGGLTDAKAEAIEQCEDEAVGRTAAWRGGIIRQAPRQIEQAASIGRREQIRNPPRRFA